MTSDETTAIMAVLATAYPQFYSKQAAVQIDLAASLWAEMFAEEPAEIVAMAVKSFIATDTKGFPPSIGIIKDHVLKVTTPPQKSEMEAWGEVKKALSNSGYNAAQEFERLDPVIQRIVGSPSQLKEWAVADTETLNSVIASNFQRSYRACAKNFRDRQVLPPAISEMVNLLAANMDLKPEPPPEPTPKALPVSADAVLEELKQASKGLGEYPIEPPPKTEKRLSPEEFEKKRAEILAQIQQDKIAEVLQ